MDDLPNELLIEILSYIRVQERQLLATVCKQWKLVIEMMWGTVHELIINIGPKKCQSSQWEGLNCARILCRNFFDAVKVLKKLNGNLEKLDFACDYHVTELHLLNKLEWKELCNEIKMNEELNSIRIGSLDFEDQALRLQLLQCLPTEKLQNLSLCLTDYNSTCAFLRIFKALMKAPLGLKYLHVKNYPSSVAETIYEIETLESLHLHHQGFQLDYTLPDISRFPNLKELTVYNWALVNLVFLKTLGENGKSLRALKVTYEYLSQYAFECIGKLENLTQLYLYLDDNRDLDMLCDLSNLEELYIYFGCMLHPNNIKPRLPYIIKQLPKLKRCWFDNDDIHKMLESNNNLGEVQLGRPEDLHTVVWNRIFGIPPDKELKKDIFFPMHRARVTFTPYI